MKGKLDVLFLSETSSACSQMLAALCNNKVSNKLNAYAAKYKDHKINQNVTQVMNEVGIHSIENEINFIENFLDRDFDLVVTICDQSNSCCTMLPPARKVLHQEFINSKKLKELSKDEQATLNYYRHIRDEFIKYVDSLPASLDIQPTPKKTFFSKLFDKLDSYLQRKSQTKSSNNKGGGSCC